MSDHLDLLRRIAESPSGVIAPRTGIRSVHTPMEDVIASLEKLYAEGLIVSVRVVQARGDAEGPVAFSARLTSAGRASLAGG
jgi:hypothetical protein